MKTAVITDHLFPSVDIEKNIIESAGFSFKEIQPICKTEDDIIRECGDADALIVQFAPVTRRVLEALPQVKCLVRYGVGVNNLDMDAAKDLGITVANVPDYCLDEVSDHAVAMILVIGRRIAHDHNSITNGGFGINPFRPIPAFADTTLGLVSFGRISRKVAEKAKVFGIKIIAFDPYLEDSVFEEYGVERVDLDTLIRTSDFISLHCPLAPDTTHLINKESISKMKDRVAIINTSRGQVIKEPDLIEALISGKVVGAGLDVFKVEPLPLDSPLRKMNNVILTSHSASASERSTTSLKTKAAEAARDFLLGKRPASVLV